MATETCSGCAVARYCGAFCQHKDWEEHVKTCRKENNKTPDAAISPVTEKVPVGGDTSGDLTQ